jgi:hypothetical protein
MSLSAHDFVPMFRIRNIVDAAIVDYRDIWQRSNLLLIAVAHEDAPDPYLAQLGRHLAGNDTAVVVTTDPIPGVPAPAVVVADRWGEIQYIQTAGRASDLPDAAELADWLDYVRYQCPECQGEAR